LNWGTNICELDAAGVDMAYHQETIDLLVAGIGLRNATVIQPAGNISGNMPSKIASVPAADATAAKRRERLPERRSLSCLPQLAV
jgi:hypothetical protein